MNDFKRFKELGISTFPVSQTTNKPALGSWKCYQERFPTDAECDEWESLGRKVGIVTGEVSGNLFLMDFDEKYNLLGKEPIMNRWTKHVKDVDGSILDKVLVQRTRSNGWHVIFRCEDKPHGNMVYANRPTTATETGKTKALLESRGEGGFGYFYGEPAKGSWDDIPVLTAKEIEILETSARMLNEVIEVTREKINRPQTVGLSPLDDYDASNDSSVILELLLEYGWSINADCGKHWKLTRPGKNPRDGASATLDFFPGLFYPWSSEGVFEDEKGCTFAEVYTRLVHDGDFKAATKALAKEGYGESVSDKEKQDLLDRMLGKGDAVDITDEEEAAVMGQISNSKKEMDSYITYLATARDFKLSPKYSHLNTIMKDIQPGYYVGWAAASGVGKTSTTRQIFNDYLNSTGQDGIFFTMELKSRELALRNAQETRDPDDGDYVDKDVTNRLLLSDKDFRESIISDWSRFHSVETAYDVKVMCEMAKVFKRVIGRDGRKLGVIAVDFVQMAKGGHNIESQPEIASFLKYMAKSLDVVVVGILQLNSTIGKFEEPTENHISGHKALFQTSDFGYLLWKNATDPRRIIVASKKERHSLAGRCDLVQVGMRIHSEEHREVTREDMGRAAGNRGL